MQITLKHSICPSIYSQVAFGRDHIKAGTYDVIDKTPEQGDLVIETSVLEKLDDDNCYFSPSSNGGFGKKMSIFDRDFPALEIVSLSRFDSRLYALGYMIGKPGNEGQLKVLKWLR